MNKKAVVSFILFFSLGICICVLYLYITKYGELDMSAAVVRNTDGSPVSQTILNEVAMKVPAPTTETNGNVTHTALEPDGYTQKNSTEPTQKQEAFTWLQYLWQQLF